MSSPKRIGTEFDFDNLGNNLKKIRKGLRKTQSEVAEELTEKNEEIETLTA